MGNSSSNQKLASMANASSNDSIKSAQKAQHSLPVPSLFNFSCGFAVAPHWLSVWFASVSCSLAILQPANPLTFPHFTFHSHDSRCDVTIGSNQNPAFGRDAVSGKPGIIKCLKLSIGFKHQGLRAGFVKQTVRRLWAQQRVVSVAKFTQD